MKIEKGLSSQEILLKLLDIPKEDLEEFTFSTPEKLKDPVVPIREESLPNENIKADHAVVITAKADSKRYEGSIKISYRKIHLERQFWLKFGYLYCNWRYNDLLIPQEKFTQEGIWEYINQYQYLLRECLDVSITINNTNKEAVVMIRPKQDNIIYYGSMVSITLRPVSNAVDIATLSLQQTNLSFEYDTEIHLDNILLEAYQE